MWEAAKKRSNLAEQIFSVLHTLGPQREQDVLHRIKPLTNRARISAFEVTRQSNVESKD